MKWYIKFLLVLSFLIPICIELRTLAGIFNFKLGLKITIFITILIATIIIIIDEKLQEE